MAEARALDAKDRLSEISIRKDFIFSKAFNPVNKNIKIIYDIPDKLSLRIEVNRSKKLVLFKTEDLRKYIKRK